MWKRIVSPTLKRGRAVTSELVPPIKKFLAIFLRRLAIDSELGPVINNSEDVNKRANEGNGIL